jgi:hypothetical protein
MQGWRTLALCFLAMVGAWTLAYLTRETALVYAFALASSGPLGLWISGKGIAGYQAVLAGKTPQFPAPAVVAPATPAPGQG